MEIWSNFLKVKDLRTQVIDRRQEEEDGMLLCEGVEPKNFFWELLKKKK